MSRTGVYAATSVNYFMSATDRPNIRPFLKWVGGKTQLIDRISTSLPQSYNRYFEPFVGGGAVLFRLIPSSKEAFISDINRNLIAAYADIRDDSENVLLLYEKILAKFLSLQTEEERKEFYKFSRGQYNLLRCDEKSPFRTALLLFMNKTCFNGVYRENSKGEFNVPYGRPNLKTLRNVGHILQVSERLQSVHIRDGSYEITLQKAKKGDLIYLDPPYVPLTSTANFTKYHSTDFGEREQIRLSEVFKELDARGCYILLSNSQSSLIKELYKDYWHLTLEVDANRTINCKGSLRKPVKEVLIRNYKIFK